MTSASRQPRREPAAPYIRQVRVSFVEYDVALTSLISIDELPQFYDPRNISGMDYTTANFNQASSSYSCKAPVSRLFFRSIFPSTVRLQLQAPFVPCLMFVIGGSCWTMGTTSALSDRIKARGSVVYLNYPFISRIRLPAAVPGPTSRQAPPVCLRNCTSISCTMQLSQQNLIDCVTANSSFGCGMYLDVPLPCD